MTRFGLLRSLMRRAPNRSSGIIKIDDAESRQRNRHRGMP